MNIFKESGRKIKTGRRGEAIAKRYLQNNRYTIIEENFRTKRYEIDLIALYKGVLVFIEVRTRTNEKFGTPEESFNRRKIIKLIRSARAYTAKKMWKKTYRIDAICIVLSNDYRVRRISHYKNITF